MDSCSKTKGAFGTPPHIVDLPDRDVIQIRQLALLESQKYLPPPPQSPQPVQQLQQLGARARLPCVVLHHSHSRELTRVGGASTSIPADVQREAFKADRP